MRQPIYILQENKSLIWEIEFRALMLYDLKSQSQMIDYERVKWVLAKFCLSSISGIIFCSIHSCFPQGSYLSFCCFSQRFSPSCFLAVVMVEGMTGTVQNTPTWLHIPTLGSHCAAPSNGVTELPFPGFYTGRKVCAGSSSSSQLKILTTLWSFSVISA